MELVPSTPDEYVKLTTTILPVTSGAIVKIKTMGSSSYVYAMDMFDADKLKSDNDVKLFVKENFELIANKIVHPNILEPKLQPEQLFFMDVVDLFIELMILSGIIKRVDANEGE